MAEVSQRLFSLSDAQSFCLLIAREFQIVDGLPLLGN
jgi:hypothetical protein